MSLPFCPRGGRRSLPRSAERNSPLRFSEKLPPVRGEPAYAVRVPQSAGAEKEPPVRGEHANAVRVPRSAGAEKEPTVRGEHADAVRVPRSAGAEKLPSVRGEPPAQFAYPAQPVLKKSCRPDRVNRLRSSHAPEGRCRKTRG